MKIRILLPILFLCLAASTAQAQLNVSNGFYFDNEFENFAPYRAVRFTVENPYSNAVQYRITMNANNVALSIPNQELAAGEQRTYNIPILKHEAYRYAGSQMSINVIDNSGKSAYLPVTSKNTVFLNIANINNWPSEVEMRTFTTNAIAQIGLSGSHSVRGGSTPPADNYVQCLEPIDLADNWQCFAPFRVVFVSETAEASLSHAARAALMDYVKMGGEMIIYDTGRSEEESILFGKVKRVQNNPIKAGNIDGTWAQCDPRFRVFRGESNNNNRENFPYVTKIAGGSMGGLILATLFFIIAGPVNYLHFKRKGRIRMLMISLPVISIVFCLAITAFFIAVQGFARKGGSVSLTLVDEARASALTFGRHSLFSGLYPLGGFTFNRETSFFPTRVDDRGSDNCAFQMAGGEQNLTSGLFKPSIDFHYATITPSGTKEKMVYDADAKTIAGGFEAGVQALVLYDNGQFFAAENVGTGKPVALRVIQPSADIEEAFYGVATSLSPEEKDYIQRSMSQLFDPIKTAVQRGERCYIALLEKSPDKAMAGLGEEFGTNVHILAGIMKTEQ